MTAASEHILIPRARYEQLLARMTNASESKSKPSDAEGGSFRRIVPQKVKGAEEGDEESKSQHTSRTDNFLHNDQGEGSEQKHSNQKNLGNKSTESSKLTPAVGPGRSLEEIASNHHKTLFLPPGELDEHTNNKVKLSKRRNVRQSKSDAGKLKHKKQIKRSKPYSVVGRKWISV
jgi:hypothetical protein